MAQSPVIKEGDTVIFDENGDRKSIVKVRSTGSVRLSKHNVPLAQFLGMPFGAVFTLSPDGQKAERIEQCPVGEWAQGSVPIVERNNASLFDRNTDNQKLSAEDIAAMKQAGKAGQEIIEALCSNSATFQNKTEFSQEKYKRKKAKKYLVSITLRRPTGRLISQVYYDKGPERVYNLRPDSLAIMLSLANIAAGSKVLVVDGCVGVVLASVVERLGGLGAVVAGFVDTQTPVEPSRSLNLPPEHMTCVHSSPLRVMLKLKAEQGQQQGATEAAQAAGPSQTAAASEQQPMDVDAVPVGSDAPQEQANGQQQPQEEQQQQQDAAAGLDKHAARAQHIEAEKKAVQQLVADGFDCCILANPKFHPTDLLTQIWPLLNPSAAFVVYSCWPQPLAECYTHLQINKQAVLLQLQESWLRPYQVLPARTHPNMMCAGTGGFILSGIKVLSDKAPVASIAGASTGAPSATGARGTAGDAEDKETGAQDGQQREEARGDRGRGGRGGRAKRGRR